VQKNLRACGRESQREIGEEREREREVLSLVLEEQMGQMGNGGVVV